MRPRPLCLGLAVLLAVCAPGVHHPDGIARAAEQTKVLVIGFDGMDPRLLRQYRDEGALPNLDRFISRGDFRELGTSIPPQSPVAWSNFITGQNPGGHGIFDFIHRRPDTMVPYLSTSDAQPPSDYWRIGKWKFPKGGGGVELLRRGTAFWELLAAAGLDVTIFKIPANFPPVECEARCLAGMGTPDILGTYGIFSYITDHPPADTDIGGGRIITVDVTENRTTFTLPGPMNTYREGDPESSVEVQVTIDPVHPAATFRVGDDSFLLQEGEWSDWTTVSYQMIPIFKTTTGICRFYLMEVRPHFRLYVTPVQIDPLNPEMPISTPGDYAAELAEAIGLYYTQGLPDDTKALDEGVFGDDDYVAQSDLVLQERLTQFGYELNRFRDLDGGFLFFYFNSPDQCCHMCWRNMDPDHPNHASAEGKHGERIREVYQVLDQAVGRALQELGDDCLIIIMSDHGFAPYYRSFHLNSWLLENGYLHLRPRFPQEDVEFLIGVDWSRTRAYNIGINALYLNLRGREGNGIVAAAEREAILQELVTKLEAVIDPENGQPAIKYAYRTDEVYSGPHREIGPDIIVGYHRGYRGSNESSLGKIPRAIFMDNMLAWSGDHLMAADEVPGVILANRKIVKTDPSLLDMAPTILRLFDLEPTPEMIGSDIFAPGGVSSAKGDH